MQKNRPSVGVGVIVVKDHKVLFGKRKNAHGEGMWSFPGGHLEFNEGVEECAKREVAEEVGISIKNIQKVTYTNDLFLEEGKHYITCFVRADYDDGEVRVMEPDKSEMWEWFAWDDLPEPLFLPIQNLLKEKIDFIL
jgi:8-oxo-dGTP diphosphatase